MLLQAIERLLLLNLSKQIETADAEDDGNYAEKSATDGTGIFGYVSTVFSSENPAFVPEEQLAVSRCEDGIGERLIRRCNRPVHRHIVRFSGAFPCYMTCGLRSNGGLHNPGHPRTTPCHTPIVGPGRDVGAYLNTCSGSAPPKFWNPSLTVGVGIPQYVFIIRALRPHLNRSSA